jgi:electron transfer flavoprotein beta subunit
VKLPEIMKAKTKPLATIPLAELATGGASRVKVVKTEPPPARRRGIMVKDANELFTELSKRGLV